MLWDDLVASVGPADMMMFEGDVSRFRRDEWSFGEVDGGGVISEHDGGVFLRKSEVLCELAPMDKLFCRAREDDIFAFVRMKRDAFFFCRVGAEWRCCCARFADGYLIGSVRLSVRMNVVSAIGGRMDFNAVGVIGWIRREYGSDVRARFYVAK